MGTSKTSVQQPDAVSNAEVIAPSSVFVLECYHPHVTMLNPLPAKPKKFSRTERGLLTKLEVGTNQPVTKVENSVYQRLGRHDTHV